MANTRLKYNKVCGALTYPGDRDLDKMIYLANEKIADLITEISPDL